MLTMHGIAFVLICSMHEGHGAQVRDQLLPNSMEKSQIMKTADATFTPQSHSSFNSEGLAMLLLALYTGSAFNTYAHGALLPMDKAILTDSNLMVSGGHRNIGHRAPAMTMRRGRSSAADQKELSADGSLQLSRRAMLGLAALLPALPAGAVFESKEQNAMTSVASLKLKLPSLISATSELKRKRLSYMAIDTTEDDYRLRFSRFEMEPKIKDFETAAKGLKAENALALSEQFAKYVKAFDFACRRKEVVNQLESLTAIDRTIGEFLVLGKKENFDVKQVNDLNLYEGLAPFIYNPVLFKQVPK
mmetsp:Transcript_139141/g.245879  ORF Transcript_139141/g.245879 Transcript_139141/m.245879 type:complete len:304 (+) Transcript_139141:57-968(+)